jgi:hypothetical protein
MYVVFFVTGFSIEGTPHTAHKFLVSVLMPIFPLAIYCSILGAGVVQSV